MRKRTIEISVGLFMLLGFAALAFLAIQVSGISGKATGETYHVYAGFENIGGLTERSKVTVAGVTVGRVSRIYLDKTSLMGIAEMEIQAEYNDFSTDTTAAILTSGLLGEKYIGLVVGADEEYLADGDTIYDTQSALVLEDLIGQFLFNKVNE